MIVLLFVALWFNLRDIWYMSYLVLFSPFSIAITSLWEERANLIAFRTFVRFVLVWFCLFPLSLGVWAAVCDCGTPWTFLLPLFWHNLSGKEKQS